MKNTFHENCEKMKSLRGRDLRDLGEDELLEYLEAAKDVLITIGETFGYFDAIGQLLCAEADRRNANANVIESVSLQ